MIILSCPNCENKDYNLTPEIENITCKCGFVLLENHIIKVSGKIRFAVLQNNYKAYNKENLNNEN